MRVRWLGRVPYAEAWDLQRAIAARSDDDVLLLLEHPPTITLGAHADPSHVLADPADRGVEVFHVDRGGDVTAHGPGQLVGYPIRSVGDGPHQGPRHVALVEQVVIDAVVALGVPADRVGRLPGLPGIWIDPAGGPAGQPPRKVAAVGVRTARGRTTHGFALNVTTDLSLFNGIVPCGIPDRPVTSLAAEGLTVGMAEAVDAVIAAAIVGRHGTRRFGWKPPGPNHSDPHLDVDLHVVVAFFSGRSRSVQRGAPDPGTTRRIARREGSSGCHSAVSRPGCERGRSFIY